MKVEAEILRNPRSCRIKSGVHANNPGGIAFGRSRLPIRR
jgi:hypothetical protein